MSQIDQATVKFSLCNNILLEHDGEKAISEKPKSYLDVSKSINALTVSDDGSLVVSANNAGAISVWDRSQGKLYKQVRASIYTECVSIAPDKRTLWVGGCSFDKSGDDGLIELLDLDSGKQISVIDSHNRPVKNIAFSRDGRLAASTGVSWKVIAWDLSSGEALLVGQHPDSGERVIFTPDNSRLVSIGGDWTMKIWDLKTRSCTATWEGEPGYYGVALSADGKWATIGNKDEGRKMIDVANGKTFASWDFTGYKNALYVSPQNSQVVWEGSDNLLKGWHVQTKKHVTVLEKHAAEISAVAISLDGTCVVSGAEDGTIGIWNVG